MSIVLPVSAKDALICASGMGWYSLSTGLVYTYSPSLSVATFVYCVSREVLSIVILLQLHAVVVDHTVRRDLSGTAVDE